MRATPFPTIFAAIIVLSLAFRVVGLMNSFPILVDEAIYLRWAEIVQHQRQWLVPLLDGKTPLSTWIYAGLRLFPGDPLLEARAVSVVAGVLSTVGLFLMGKRLRGIPVGFGTACLYAVLPFGVLYDRLAYTDSLVNLFGIAVCLASLWCFEDSRPKLGKAAVCGLILGLGYFTKPTVLLFGGVPLAIAITRYGKRWIDAIPGLALILSITCSFVLFCWLTVPNAPTYDFNHPVLHHTSLFTPIGELLRTPMKNAGVNISRLAEYWTAYISLPGLLLALFSLTVVVLRHRGVAAAVVLSATVVPILVQVLALEYFPSRYVFAHTWPLLLSIALVAETMHAPWRYFLVLLLLPLPVRSAELLVWPRRYVHPADAKEFLGSGPYAGFGIAEAISLLRAESTSGPLVVLTDPIWGTPADAVFAYLNGRNRIRVFDAWWMQISADQPILPAGPMEVMKSQYERVAAGTVDFSEPRRVFYVTDTNYNGPDVVRSREPTARLVARFHKPAGDTSIDVYQLR